MEFFHRAKAIRLKSQHNKFMSANEDEESVRQHANGASSSTRWTIEFVDGKPNVIRLKSSMTWKYLQASDEHFLLGLTGNRVIQASPRLRSDPSVEWEPIKEGLYVKLRTHRGSFMHANGSFYPWRSTVTHQMPSPSSSRNRDHDWMMWVVDILEFEHTTLPAEVDTGKKVADNSFEEESVGVYSEFSGGRTGSPVESITPVRTPSPQPQVADSCSRSSSTSSNKETPISSYTETTPTNLEPMEEVSSLHNIQNHKNSFKNSKMSNAFSDLDSIIANADKLIDNKKQKSNKYTLQDPTTEPSYSHTSSRPLPLEIRMAKQTLFEANDLDFETILTTNRLKRIEKAISVLSRTGNLQMSSLLEQFEAMKLNREKAVIDLEEYEVYGEKKVEMKEELQKKVGKARGLQKREEELCEVLEMARKRREEIVRELERVEKEIKEAKEEQAANEAEIEEVCAVIAQKSGGVKVMEVAEEEWKRKKKKAERRLLQVEDEWGEIKASLRVFEG